MKLRASFSQPQDVLKAIYPNGRLDGLTMQGDLPGKLGEICEVTVTVAEPANRHFTVRGRLAWARHLGTQTLRPSYGIDFITEDASGRDRLVSFANQTVTVDATRFNERVATDLAVRIIHNGHVRKESLVDLSHGGAFVRTRMPLPPGSEVEFELRPPLSLTAIRLRGRVAWARRSGDDRGMGVEFIYDNARQEERVAKLLAKLQET